MENVKLSKLKATFDKYAGRQVTFSAEYKDQKIKITGQLQKNDKQYWFANGAGKVSLEQKKSGSLLTLKGTYKAFLLKFFVGDSVLAECEIPARGKFGFKVLN